jgi:hypothetical protein
MDREKRLKQKDFGKSIKPANLAKVESMKLSWYKNCGTEGLSPDGRNIDALLKAAGYTRNECNKDNKAGSDHDLQVCRVSYSRGKNRVFIVTHEPKKGARHE